MANVSVSEIDSFLRCRRAWDWTSTNRQSLRHKTTPKMFFVVGSAVHAAIEGQANGQDPMGALEAYIREELESRRLAYREAVGSDPWQSEMEDFEASATLAKNLSRQYFNHYGAENPLESHGLKYVATEVPFSIPLSDDVNFVGTFDGIATDIATESKFFLVENKTASRKPNMADFWRRNQPIGYAWAFRELTGETPAGILYNGILKRVIDKPTVLKSGALSTNKQASVTYQSFMQALVEGGYDLKKYGDYIQFLAEREANGDDRFFFRDMHSYSNYELDQWGQNVLSPLWWEMMGGEGYDPLIYPNRLSCDNCLVRDLCEAKDYGEDVDAVVSARYKQGTYGTMSAVDGATPVRVSSSSELIQYLKEAANANSG